jgi:hypothetical protein
MRGARRGKLALGIALLLAALGTIDWVSTCGFSLECSVTRKEAEAIALREVHETGEMLRFDPTIFRGPELVQTDDGRVRVQVALRRRERRSGAAGVG